MITIITMLDVKTILKQQHIKTAAENVHTLCLEKAVQTVQPHLEQNYVNLWSIARQIITLVR